MAVPRTVSIGLYGRTLYYTAVWMPFGICAFAIFVLTYWNSDRVMTQTFLYLKGWGPNTKSWKWRYAKNRHEQILRYGKTCSIFKWREFMFSGLAIWFFLETRDWDVRFWTMPGMYRIIFAIFENSSEILLCDSAIASFPQGHVLQTKSS